MTRFLITFSLLLLSSCSIYKTNPAEEFSSFDGECGSDGNAGSFRKAFYESCIAPDSPTKGRAYQNAGVNSILAMCHAYLDDLESADNHLAFFKEEFGILVVLGTGILGVNGTATSEAFSRIALSAAAVNSTIDNVDNSYLLGPNSSAIHTFVGRALDTMRLQIEELPSAGFHTTRRRLGDLARTCTHKEIRDLVNSALAQADLVADAENARVNNAERETLREIASTIGVTGGLLSTEQLLAAYWVSHEGNVPEERVSELLGGITFDTFTDEAKNQLIDLFAELPRATIVFLEEQRTSVVAGDRVERQVPIPPIEETTLRVRAL